jgi:thiol-disulfide isomerase/thioredoxin
MNRRRWVVGGVALAAAAVGVGWATWRSRSGPGDVESELWSLAFEQPNGGTLVLASLRGRPVLINFWATWCPPCIKEMPMLDRFQRDKQSTGWRVVGLAVDAAVPVREYLGRLPVSFAIGLAGMEGAGLSRRLGNVNGGLPFTVVLDRGGKVMDRKLGALDPEHLERWDRLVTRMA